MLWLIGIALLVSYYVGPTAFQIIAVLSLLVVVASLAATGLAMRSLRETREGELP